MRYRTAMVHDCLRNYQSVHISILRYACILRDTSTYRNSALTHLAEKVRIVWSPSSVSRFSSRVYSISLFSVALYIIPIVFMIKSTCQPSRLLAVSKRKALFSRCPLFFPWRRWRLHFLSQGPCSSVRPYIWYVSFSLDQFESRRTKKIFLRFITIFFTGLFLWPLVPSSRRSALIRRVALRTLWWVDPWLLFHKLTWKSVSVLPL